MGWHTILFNNIRNLIAGNKTEEPTGATLMLDHGTSNFQWMAAVGWLGWALQAQDNVKIQAAYSRVMDLYELEKTVGHQLLEQTCPMPHDTFHRGAHAALRLLINRNVDVLGDDKVSNLRADNNTWWGWRLALDEAGATPDGQVILPGCRGDGGPYSQIADSIYRMYKGLPHRGAARTQAWWADPLYGGGAPSWLREAQGDGPWDVTLPDLPKLRLPMKVNRTDEGFDIQLSGHPESEPIISSVSVVFGQPDHHHVSWVKNWDGKVQEG